MPEILPLSVIVSACDSESTLGDTLAAIRSSELPRSWYELIVVDDVSVDSSVAIAARYADKVVRLTGQRCGLAYARNRATELARSPIVAFVNGDVVVRPDTLSRMFDTLRDRRDVDAVSASHDESLGPQNFVSQYWNLLVRFGEERHAARSATFAPGCAMIRRDVFLSAGMYDEWRFPTACLESAELGERLRDSGYSVLLNTELRVSHLASWDIKSLFREVWRRGRLLARSLGYVRMNSAVPSEVVFTLTGTLAPAIGLLGTLSLLGAFVPPPHATSKWAIALGALVVTNLPIHRFYARTRGLAFAVASAPLHIFAQIIAAVALCTGWILRDLFGDSSPDATTQAYAEVGLEMWPPVRRRR